MIVSCTGVSGLTSNAHAIKGNCDDRVYCNQCEPQSTLNILQFLYSCDVIISTVSIQVDNNSGSLPPKQKPKSDVCLDVQWKDCSAELDPKDCRVMCGTPRPVVDAII